MVNNKHLVNKNRWIMASLICMFIIYNAVVYNQGTFNSTPKMSKEALHGESLYQANNCTACHQLFGLGGYLGPDLTNIISNENKGPGYAKAFLNSGINAMPKFNFSEDEQNAIVQFLKEIDQCGHYPVEDGNLKTSGWVDMKYKNQ